VADQAISYYRHAGTEGMLISSGAIKLREGDTFVSMMLRNAGTPFCNAAGMRCSSGGSSLAPMVSQGFALRCANLLQVLLIELEASTGPVAVAWRDSLNAALGRAMGRVGQVLRSLRNADLSSKASIDTVSETVGAMFVCGGHLDVLRTGTMVQVDQGIDSGEPPIDGLLVLPLSDCSDGGPGFRVAQMGTPGQSSGTTSDGKS